MHEGFNSTYQVLTKFHKVCPKVYFAFGKKDQKNTQYLSKKTIVTVINVFIFNKLDFQRLLTLKGPVLALYCFRSIPARYLMLLFIQNMIHHNQLLSTKFGGILRYVKNDVNRAAKMPDY